MFGRFFTLIAVCSTLVLCACGGAKTGPEKNPIDLLRAGRYEEAISVAQKKTPRTPTDDGIIALATLARAPQTKTAVTLAQSLHEVDNVDNTALTVHAMLQFASEIQASPGADFDLLLCETALGALGLGRHAPGRPKDELSAVLSRAVAVAVLEQLNVLVSTIVQKDLPADRLLDVWNGSYVLLGDSLTLDSEVQAWRLFVCTSEMAIGLWNDKKRDPFSTTLVEFAIAVVQNNPTISVAVRCDLSSPYEKLRRTISGRRELMSDLEHSVAIAMGCSRGQYAPTQE